MNTRFNPCSPADEQGTFHFSHCAESHLSPWTRALQKQQHLCKAVSTPCSVTAELRPAHILQSPKHILFRSFKRAEIININIYSYSLISFPYSVEHSLKILPSALLTLSQKAQLLLPANLGAGEPWAGGCPAHPPPPPGAPLQTSLGRDIPESFVPPSGCTKPPWSWWLLSAAVLGPCDVPSAALAQPLPRMVVAGGAGTASGRSTTDSQHRNYSRHKENTNKDHTQQREAGISQQKRRIGTLKAAFISLCSSVHGQWNSRNGRAWGTLQVTRISSFIAYF